MRRNKAWIKAALLFWILSAGLAAGGEPPEWRVPRLDGAVQVDGFLEEPQYQQALVWKEFVEIAPRDNAPPSRTTELLLFSNEKGLVLGVRCLDPKPQEIRRQRFRRDQVEAETADIVELLLDPQGEAKQWLAIGLTAAGDVTDGLNDGSSFDPGFDFLFEHAAGLTPEGWQAELLIPYSSMTFRPGPSNRFLFMLARRVPREDMELINLVPVNRESQDPREGMVYLLVDASGAREARSWHLIPTWVGSSFVEENGQKSRAAVGELGLTAEWTPQTQTRVKATFRPDFSQVEADDTYQKINNRYPVYIAEKRPFFLEGAESFATPILLFYSRNIVLPEWGVKLSHRQEKLGLFGILAQEKSVPGERFGLEPSRHNVSWGIFRTTWALDEAGSFLGGTVTYRGFGESFNRVFSLDGQNKGEKLSLEYQLAFSETTQAEERLRGLAWRVQGSYRWNRFWSTSLRGYRASPWFRADAGFVPRVDRQSFRLSHSYHYLPQEKVGFLRQLQAEASLSRETTTRGELVSDSGSLFVGGVLPHSVLANLFLERNREVFAGQQFPGLWQVGLNVFWAEKPAFQPNFWANVSRGLLYGPNPQAGPTLAWGWGLTSRPGAWGFSVSRSHYAFVHRARTQDSWQASGEYVVGERWSVKVFYVEDRLVLRDYQLAGRSRFLNALLTYRLNVFSAAYLGVNLALEKNGTLPIQEWERWQRQQVFAKVSWYF